MKYVVLFLAITLWVAHGLTQTITVDGDMSDWQPWMQIDVPPNDVEEAGDIDDPNIDLVDIYVTHDDDSIYFRYVINENGTFGSLLDTNLYPSGAGFELNIDVDCDTSTGLNWGWWFTSSDYYLDITHPYAENEPIEWELWKFNGANGSDWSYVPAGIACHVAYNMDDNEVEISVPRKEIGETNGDYESTAFFAYASIWQDPWPEDIAPNEIGSKRYVYRYGRKQVTVDGEMDEWTEAMHFDVPPNEEEGLQDSVDYGWDGTMDDIINPALDIKDIWVSHDDDYLYVRIDINEDGTFSDLDNIVDAEGYKALIQLYFDTDLDSTTGLTWGYWLNGGDYYVNITDPHGNPGLETKQAYGILKFTGANGNDEQFEEVMGDSCIVARNIDDNKIEVAIPRAAIGETNGENESTGILVLAEDPTHDWVNDVAPNDDGSFRNIYNYGRPLGDLTAVENQHIRPQTFTLAQNYPNPFNPTTTIEYRLAKTQFVTLTVYNVLGQKIRTLVSAKQAAGLHRLVWNGQNAQGMNVPSGVYFYRLQSDREIVTKKMILIR